MEFTRRQILCGATTALMSYDFPSMFAQTSEQTASELPNTVGPLTVTPASHSQFDHLLSIHRPSLLDSAVFRKFRNTHSLVVSSDPKRGIKALAAYWPQPGASSAAIMRAYVPAGKINGRTSLMSAQYNVLAPQVAALLSPAGLIALHYGNGSEVPQTWIEQRLNSITAIRIPQSLTYAAPRVDAVVYNDWTIYGSDYIGLQDKIEAERNGQHDAGVSVLRAYAAGGDFLAVKSRLSAFLKTPAPESFNAQASLYWSARQMEEQRMLAISTQLGEVELKVHAAHLGKLSRTSLRRVESKA